jgi:DNA replication protein DnaC
VLVLGATGTGKTYLSCALGRAACEAEFNVRYVRTSRPAAISRTRSGRRLLSPTAAFPGPH